MARLREVCAEIRELHARCRQSMAEALENLNGISRRLEMLVRFSKLAERQPLFSANVINHSRLLAIGESKLRQNVKKHSKEGNLKGKGEAENLVRIGEKSLFFLFVYYLFY